MKTSLLAAVVGFVLVGCSGGGQCYDCCPAGDPGSKPLAVSCRIVRADGGPVPGAAASCGLSDAGAVTDNNGAFAFTVRQLTCGIGTGSTDCSFVNFTLDGGPLSLVGPSSDAGVTSLTVARLIGPGCTIVAP